MKFNTRYEFIAALARHDPIPAYPKNCPLSKGVGWSRGLRRYREFSVLDLEADDYPVYRVKDPATRESHLDANLRWSVNPTLKMTKKLWIYRVASKLSARA